MTTLGKRIPTPAAWNNLLGEFESVRKASLALLGLLPPGAEKREGVANGNRVTVPACFLAYIAACTCAASLRRVEGCG